MKLLFTFLFLICACYGKSIKLKEDNFVIIRGPIRERSASKVVADLLQFRNANEVYIYIDSGGGSVISGMEIVGAIKSLSENNVKVKCIANVALSMAFVIFQYCPVRYVSYSSVLMQHQMSVQLHGPLNNVLSHLEFIKSMGDEIEMQEATRLNLKLEDYKSLVTNDWWLFGNNSVKRCAADKFVHVLCDFDPKHVEEKIPTFFGELTVVYTSCPLSKAPVEVRWSKDLNIAYNNDRHFRDEVDALIHPDKYMYSLLTGNESYDYGLYLS